jgi:chaperonin GroEL (HSP60 family)
MGLWTSNPTQLNVYPLVVPQSVINNGQRSFLDDLAAVTGAKVFDPLTAPIENCELEPEYVNQESGKQGRSDVGNVELDSDLKWVSVGSEDPEIGIKSFECGRYRSTIIGFCNPELVLNRQQQVKQNAENSESELEKNLLLERAAKLTGSIAKLKVIGSSNGELKERRDRAEDAVCAVRGALKDGALIGGGWSLIKMVSSLNLEDPIENEIVQHALWEPVMILYQNAGLLTEDSEDSRKYLAESFASTVLSKSKNNDILIRDVSSGKMVKAIESGILDSLPAVKEALKNAISIATLLGTLGGCVVFKRDKEVDRIETKSYNQFVQDLKIGEMANERAM